MANFLNKLIKKLREKYVKVDKCYNYIKSFSGLIFI